ncbi:hypothetical protein V6Z12_A10G136400 [Gossypium hirsutum]
MLGSAWLGADFLKKICLEKEKSLFNSSKGKAAARWGKNWFKARLGLEFVEINHVRMNAGIKHV